MGGWGEAGSPTTSTRRVCSIYSRARGFTPRAGETLRRATRVFPRVEEAGRGARQEVRGKRVPPSPPPPPFAAVSLGCNNCAQELRASGGSNCYLRSKSRTGYAPRGPPAPPPPPFQPRPRGPPAGYYQISLQRIRPAKYVRSLYRDRARSEKRIKRGRPLITRLRSRSVTQCARFINRGTDN